MLTAAEWNERYPVGTPVLCRVGGRRTVTLTTHPAGVDPTGRSADQVYTEDVGWLNLSDVEPLATDAERLAAGWLDPERAQALLDAARAWRHSPQGVGSWLEGRALADAIDALDAAEATPC